MHHLLKASSLLLAVLATFLSGCTTGGSPHVSLSTISRVYVADTVGASTSETASASNAVHDASVSELRRLGYVVVTNTSEADAVLKSSWRIKKSEDNRNDLQVASLSVSLFDKKNHRLFDADSGPSVPANFWNESRASTEIASMLNRLGRATTSQK
jgi:hypothetical protein